MLTTGQIIGLLVVALTFFLLKPRSPKKIKKAAPTLNAKATTFSKYDQKVVPGTSKEIVYPIRFAAEGPASEQGCPPTTIGKLFAKAVAKRGSKIALRCERPVPEIKGSEVPGPLPLDQWKSWTWQQYSDECRVAARAFIALGLQPFDGVNIYGFNAPEWFMGEIAGILAGGIAAGIYPTDTPDQVIFKSEHSGGSIAVVEDEGKAKVFTTDALKKVKAVVIWAPSASFKRYEVKVGGRTVVVCAWSDLASIANDVSDQKLQERIDAQQPGNVCAYIYTSGTTGNPKAVMITHDNIIFESSSVLPLMGDAGTKEQEERVISYLPLSHVAGMMVDIICPLVVTAQLPGWVAAHFARPYDLKVGTLGDRLRTVQPTLFLGVPRVWEKIAEKMKAIGASTKGAKLKIAKFSKGKGLEHAKNCEMGGSGAYPSMYGLADKLVLSAVKNKLGLDKCTFGFTGAAPISSETLEYFGALGIMVNEVYGMSECTGATTWSTDDAHVWGSCGFAMPGTEVKIFQVDPSNINKKKESPVAGDLFNPTEEEQGEICFRGRHIMAGYMANPDLGAAHVKEIQKKTVEAIDEEGWLHSGDKGCVDARGMVKITGRYKELIIGAGGENIAPVPIEDEVKRLCPGISNIMMIGDKQKFNIAVVSLKTVGATGEKPGTDQLDGPALQVNPEVTTVSGAIKDEKWIKTIESAIMAANKNGKVCPSNASKIQKFTILPVDFSVETGELTPTLKLKRSVVEKKYATAITKVYASDANYVPFPV